MMQKLAIADICHETELNGGYVETLTESVCASISDPHRESFWNEHNGCPG